jgi:hypothetical protein
MSLISASGIITGLKEYVYRGIQQLPIVLASTSLLFTITTGSIAHLNIFLGMFFLRPAYTFLLQNTLGGFFGLNRATGDTCDLVTLHQQKDLTLKYFTQAGQEFTPSYWVTGVGYFFGYAFSNIYDTVHELPSDDSKKEAFHNQATFIAINTSIFFLLLLFMRFYFMKGCDGISGAGMAFSVASGIGAGFIGWIMYTFSKQCGARSTDLFGVVSQFIPLSAGAPKPVVCTNS